MPALIIIFSIAALITALLFLNVSLVIEHNEKTKVFWKVLFFKKRAHMTKEKKLKRSMSKKEAAKIRAELDEKNKKERKKRRDRKLEDNKIITLFFNIFCLFFIPTIYIYYYNI